MATRFDFTGKHALVTGAGKGIGRDLVKCLWKAGAKVTALSRTQSDLDSLKAEYPAISVARADLRNWTETQKVLQDCGDVDLLINNAALFRPSSVLDTAEEAYDAVFETNVKAVINVTQMVARKMVERKKGGAIVNISTMLSQRAFTGSYIYCASKGAMDQLTRAMAVELGPHNIRVNSVHPTSVGSTEMARMAREHDSAAVQRFIDRTPLGRLAETEDIINAILYLLSDSAAMISGTMVQVDGGFLCT